VIIQIKEGKEVIGWLTSDGKVFVLPLTGTDQSGQSSTNTQLTSNTYSSYQDSQGRTLLSVNQAQAGDLPGRLPGMWYLDYYSYDGTTSTHLVTGHVHTHPMNGHQNEPSPTDKIFAGAPPAPGVNGREAYPGVRKYILNNNNLVEYDRNGAKNTQTNNCQ